MPRNSSGVYSLPAGNPVVTGTVISSIWGNTTMTDIGTALSDSLSRSGQGGMTAGLQLFAGVIGAPGLTWSLETTSGLYRKSAGVFAWAIGGADVFTLTSSGILVPQYTASDSIPKFIWIETDAAANNRRWDAVCLSETLSFRVVNDADSSATTWMAVDRTLNVVDGVSISCSTVTLNAGVLINASSAVLQMNETSAAVDRRKWGFFANTGNELRGFAINDAGSVFAQWLGVTRSGASIVSVNFPNGSLQYGGLEVGYRQLNDRTFSVSDNTTAADAGKMVSYTGTGGHTFTADTDPAISAVITVRNAGSAALTLAGSVSLQWYNGSGTISFGNRTLAVGGIATMYQGSAGNYLVWGTGLS